MEESESFLELDPGVNCRNSEDPAVEGQSVHEAEQVSWSQLGGQWEFESTNATELELEDQQIQRPQKD